MRSRVLVAFGSEASQPASKLLTRCLRLRFPIVVFVLPPLARGEHAEMAGDRVERRLLVVKLDPNRPFSCRPGADLGDSRGVRLAQLLFDVDVFRIPVEDVS